MKRIVECLLEEGIDESVIHRILDLIEEEYNVCEVSDKYIMNPYNNLELEKAKRIARKGIAMQNNDPEAFDQAEKEYLELRQRGIDFKKHKQEWKESKRKKRENND